MNASRATAVRLVGVALLVLLLVASSVVLSFSSFRQMKEAAAGRAAVDALLNNADDLLSELRDAEIGQRGYLLTGDDAFLEPYQKVHGLIPLHFSELRQLARAHAGKEYLDAMAPLIPAKLAELSRVIELRRNHDMAGALARVRGGDGKRLMDAIRVEMGNFVALLSGTEVQREAEFQQRLRFLFGMLVAASAAALLFALTFAWLIRRDNRQRLGNLVHLQTRHLLDVQTATNLALQTANATLQISEEKYAVTLNSIGDAVIATDARACVTFLNPLAIQLTGWAPAQAIGRPVADVFHIVNQETRQPAVIPVLETLASGTIQGLANHTVLIARDSREYAIADSCAPIRDRDQVVVGAVLVFRDVTAEYVAQQALRDGAALVRSILDTVLDGIVTFHARDGVIQDVNLAAGQMSGYAPAELVGQRFSLLIDAADQAGIPSFLDDMPDGGIVHEVSARRKDGSQFPMEMAVREMQLSGERFFIAILRDLTARKQADEALLEAEGLQSAIFNSANFSSIATDAKGVIQIFNVGAERMLGYAAADVVNKITPADISDPQELIARATALSLELETPIRPGFEALVFKASRGIEDIYELTYVRKDGRRFPAVVSVTALRDARDAIIGYLLIGTDNTARRQIEEEQKVLAQRLRDHQFYTRSLFEANMDALMTTDPSGIITDVNKQMEALTGSTRDELIGAPFKNCFTDPARAESGIKLVLAQKKVTDFELTAQARDGKETVVSYNATTFYDRDRKLQGVFAAARDVTDRKFLDRILQEKNAELESARLAADKANLAKSEFLATMSHEIRTPMNGVIGMIDVLQQSSLTGQQMEMADIIHDSAFALLAVINDILDFSKIEANKLQVEAIPLSIADVVERACENINNMATKNTVDLTLFIDPAIPAQVLGDPGRLRQILINLINNAIKFSTGLSRQGRVSVRVLLAGRAADHVQLAFHVADNGIGIEEEARARLFTAFNQADASTTRNFGGTGLGLAITRKLVTLMGGDIAVTSAPDQGSLFSVRIGFDLPRGYRDGVDGALQERKPSLIVGVPCLVLVGAAGMGADLATYLDDDGALARRVTDLDGARAWLAEDRARSGVVVLDGVDGPLLEALREAARATTGVAPHFLLIGRGKRRRPRVETADLVRVDGNLLSRKVFLTAVAIAAGAVSEPDRDDPVVEARAVLKPLSRDAARRKGTLILVAEDNESNQKVILQQLRLLGQTADIANNGIEALKRWQSGDYRILITDLHMPGMDGYDLTAAIRAAEAILMPAGRAPIIAFTANALKGEAEHCRAVGMDDYLSKPVQLVNLQAMLDKWLPVALALPERAMGASMVAAPLVTKVAASVVRPIVDVSVLEALIGADEATVREFLQDFRGTAATIAAELRVAGAAGQARVVGALAHKLKSSALAVGALDLGDLCAALEAAGKHGDMDSLTGLLVRFDRQLRDVDRYLETW